MPCVANHSASLVEFVFCLCRMEITMITILTELNEVGLEKAQCTIQAPLWNGIIMTTVGGLKGLFRGRIGSLE